MSFFREKLRKKYDGNVKTINILNKEIDKLNSYTLGSTVLITSVIATLSILYTSLATIFLLPNLSLAASQGISFFTAFAIGGGLGHLYTKRKLKNNNISTYIPDSYKELNEKIIEKEIEAEKIRNHNIVINGALSSIDNMAINSNNKNDLICETNIIKKNLDDEMRKIDKYSVEKILGFYSNNLNYKSDILLNSVLYSVCVFCFVFLLSNVSTLFLVIKNGVLYNPLNMLSLPLICGVASIPISYNIIKDKFMAKEELKNKYNAFKNGYNYSSLCNSIDKGISLTKELVSKKEALELISDKDSNNEYSYTNKSVKRNSDELSISKEKVKVLKP